MLWVLVLLLCPALRAHDPYESWAQVSVRAQSLELSVTMAQATALRLIDPERKAGPLTFENFLAHLRRLEEAAPGLLVLTGSRQSLLPRKVEVDLTEENDIVFKLTYPRPPPGPLRFHAGFIRRLGEGYGGIIEINDAAGENLGWERLTYEQPDFEFKLPPPPAAPPPNTP